MKTFLHITLLALLFTTSATSQMTTSTQNTPTSATAQTTTAPTTTLTSATAQTTTAPTTTLTNATAQTTTAPPTTTATSTTAQTTTAPPTTTATSTTAQTTTAPPTTTATSTTAQTTTAPPTTTATSTTAQTTTAPPTTTATSTTAQTTTASPTTTLTSTTAQTTTAPPTTTLTSATAQTTTASPTTTLTSTTAQTTTAPPTTTLTSATAQTTTASPTTTLTSTTAQTTTASPTTTATSTTAQTTTTSPTKTTSGSASSSSTTIISTSTTVSTTLTPQNSQSTPNPDTRGTCKSNSCEDSASCVNLNNAHFCLCIDGYYYESSKCNKGKVFPGTISVSVSNSDIPDLEDKMSVSYENLYMKVTKFFEDIFINSGYGQTIIHKVTGVSSSTRFEVRANDNSQVDVTVVNLFPESTTQNETTVLTAIKNEIQAKPGDITGYISQDQCDFYGCEKMNEKDDCSDGLLCKCKPGLERPNPQIALCLPVSPQCSDTCTKEYNKQCLVKTNGNSDCVCLPGYQKDDQGNCQMCAFGYSGVDCKDQFQLILTIVGTIAGILILGMVIALIVVRSKNRHRDNEERKLIENDFLNLQLQHTSDFSNPGAEGSIFPKVRAAISRDSQPQNPYTNLRGLPRPDY